MEPIVSFSPPLTADDKVIFRKSSPLKQKLNSSRTYAVQEKIAKKITVFLVDDDPLFLKALELSISGSLGSVEIKTFQTGEACLQHMKLKPDIIILDYYLNSKIPYAWNGVDILKQIKQLSSKTKVIMLSSQDSLNIAINCMDNGAYDYVSKSPSALVRINTILSNIIGNIEATNTLLKGYQFILLIIILAIVVGILLNS